MNEQEEINPYAAPQSETSVGRPAEERIRRPASVKWVLAMMILAVITTSILHAQLFPEQGWRLWTDYPLGTVLDASKFIGCFALLFGGRRPWVYWAALVPLAGAVISGVQMFLRGWPGLFRFDPFGKSIEGFFILLFFYLCYRFIFGQPSRAYFGVSRVN